ncbi:mitochondrial carrier [Thermothelomyces heterothallicus CBS 203.75]
MTETKDAGLPPALVETIAGLSAGSMATLIVHPLDIVKTRMQIYRTALSSASSSSAGTKPSPPTTVSLIRSLARTDRPLAALYRGLTPNLLGNATSWASFFFFKSRFERAIAHLRAAQKGPYQDQQEEEWSHELAAQQRQLLLQHHRRDEGEDGEVKAQAEPSARQQQQPPQQQQHRLTPADFFVASLAAGAATQVITNPIWVLKTRMLSSDRSAAGAYPSMWAGAVRLVREEGVRGFYRGLGVGMLAVSHGAVQFAVYDPARRMYLAGKNRRMREQQQPGPRGVKDDDDDNRAAVMSNEATIVLSTVSKLVAGAATYPLQVLRSRLQQHDAEEQFGRGVSGVVRRLWREEGVRGFYRGVMPGVVRVLPATWVTFLVYENVKYYLPRRVQREDGRVEV